MHISISFIFAKRELLASQIDIHSNCERRRRVGLKREWEEKDARHERTDERRASLFAHVHIRMLFVLDIPWDPVTLDLYIHDETRVMHAGMFCARCVLSDVPICDVSQKSTWWVFWFRSMYFIKLLLDFIVLHILLRFSSVICFIINI